MCSIREIEFEIESGLKNMVKYSTEFIPLSKPEIIEAIITVCVKFNENKNKNIYINKFEKDIERLNKIISITNSLADALWDEPILPHWHDEGLSEALSHISNGSYAATMLCNKAKDKLKILQKNRPAVSPDKQLFYELACIYEDVCAHQERRNPDYSNMPSLVNGIRETSSAGQKYYMGIFYELVEFIWHDCLKQPLCQRRKKASDVDSTTREYMDSATFGKSILSGIRAGQKLHSKQPSENIGYYQQD